MRAKIKACNLTMRSSSRPIVSNPSFDWRLTMSSILDFYAPYTSSTMPTSFQRKEALFPLIATIIMAVLSTVPIFHSDHWVVGLACAIFMFIALRSIYSGMMYASSYPIGKRDERYVSPSLVGLVESYSSGLQLLVAAGGFALAAHLEGWPVLS
jgi:hypothetical protein